ncbi:BZ3500_MvSof-1268-A1-R1_Chr4-4g07480 [Microbotryum saponariae]|uniref:BZ3500_MvSof-1268-A1-R1_Chr4-4g07480 protein n=1 Tax=Microbotryum saponariae TaxID=289078 RepID=A0A2X0MVE4_9BASI|nr:BZ3500_MvSof-1268-A1-R1_Chr4-4g07480 [Microbotryum saponariae]SDA07141.1 BZ3501_MvSof-1269-A2-R1_Chr4-3g07188 [Microbotryum saponariae]
MSSSRTHRTAYLGNGSQPVALAPPLSSLPLPAYARSVVSTSDPSAAAPARSRLRKEDRRDRGGNVLPPGSGTGYGQTTKEGVVSNGMEKGGVAPRIQATVQYAKERRQQRKERRNGDGVMRRNMPVDDHGVAHDSEYVQFRTATPVHVHSQRNQLGPGREHDDDGSASESSASTSSSTEDSGASRFGPTPYSYQATTRRTSASTHHYAAPMGSTVSAIPSYLAPQPHRISLDRTTSLAVPRAPSPRRKSGDYNPSVYRMATSGYDRSAGGSVYGSSASGIGLGAPMGKNKAISSTNGDLRRQTTSSFQPPAPTFSSRPPDFDPLSQLSVTARAVSSADARSLLGSTARLSLSSSAEGSVDPVGNGYNKYALKEASTRPPNMEGTALDAGVHGMKRSWDGFKLEMKFGTHKVGKKISRKLTNSLGV